MASWRYDRASKHIPRLAHVFTALKEQVVAAGVLLDKAYAASGSDSALLASSSASSSSSRSSTSSSSSASSPLSASETTLLRSCKAELGYDLAATQQHVMRLAVVLPAMVKTAISVRHRWQECSEQLVSAGIVQVITAWFGAAGTLLRAASDMPAASSLPPCLRLSLPLLQEHAKCMLDTLIKLLDSYPWDDNEDVPDVDDGTDDAITGSELALESLLADPAACNSIATLFLPRLQPSQQQHPAFQSAVVDSSLPSQTPADPTRPLVSTLPRWSNAHLCSAVAELMSDVTAYFPQPDCGWYPENYPNMKEVADPNVVAGVVLAIQGGLVEGTREYVCSKIAVPSFPGVFDDNHQWLRQPQHAWALGALARLELADLLGLAFIGRLIVWRHSDGDLKGITCPAGGVGALNALLGKGSPFSQAAKVPPSDAAIAAMTSFLCNGSHDATLDSPVGVFENHRPHMWMTHDTPRVSMRQYRHLARL